MRRNQQMSKYGFNTDTVPVPAEWQLEIAAYSIYLQSRNLSPKTVDISITSIEMLARWRKHHGYADSLGNVDRASLQAWLADSFTCKQSAGVITNYHCCKRFFKYLVNEDVITVNPFDGVGMPKAEETMPSVLSIADIKALLATCSGKTLVDRRDTALMLLFLDTGLRLSECARININDIDMTTKTIAVMGKGRIPSVVTFSLATANALNSYKRARDRYLTHKDWHTDRLWISERVPRLGTDMIYTIMQDRAKEAGIQHLHPHMWRHTFAHMWLSAGGQTGDLMILGRWRSFHMANKYGRKLAYDRAAEKHSQFSPANAVFKK